eukprot:CAMPEP_0172596434 /NCGR_PEP_ID=MMETSP1068-20121228/16212_1 /TAXON_ID=35684 /ORGANISM="Pseudopedinella elastica, Strain CCMP716" /LENGTH=251 /DNA_ID=CAMNT_0013395445 /DNA_START=584 /DNA_END=1336 /DNA_ORIENTATION=+
MALGPACGGFRFYFSKALGCWGAQVGSLDVDVTASNVALLIPTARLLVVVRDPTDRAYSHYWHFGEGCGVPLPKLDPACFHKTVAAQIRDLRRCEAAARSKGILGDVDSCAWGTRSGPNAWKLSSRVVSLGLYAPFLERSWLRHFSTESICVVALEQFGNDLDGLSAGTSQRLTREMAFVERCLGIIPKGGAAYSISPGDTNRRGTLAPKMLDVTRFLLDSFYAPYNARLRSMAVMSHVIHTHTTPPEVAV